MKSIFSRFTKTDKISEALLNVAHNLVNSSEIRGVQNPERIAMYVIAESCRFIGLALEKKPAISPYIGDCAIECRYYFDTLWWLYLLQIGTDEKKIADLFPMVCYRMQMAIQEMSYSAPVTSNILGTMVDEANVNGETARAAHNIYVLGEVPDLYHDLLSRITISGIKEQNAILFSLKIHAATKRKDLDTHFLDYMSAVALTGWENPLLTEFEIDKCPIITLPDEFLE